MIRPRSTVGERRQEMQSILVIEEEDDHSSSSMFENPTSDIDFQNQDETVFFSDYDTPTSAGDPKERILDLLENSKNEYCVDCQSPYPPEMGVCYKPKLE